MTTIDVFNGDADGIFSLIQLRKAFPVSQSHLITSVKRDISLLKQVDLELAKDADINVLDISYDKNCNEVESLLDKGNNIFYCDHHKADKLISHTNLTSIIDTSAFVCTGLLISNYIDRQHHLWAIAALFGDGLDKVAYEEVKAFNLPESDVEAIKKLGVLVNYNGYGSRIEELHFHPAELYRELMRYSDPLEVIADKSSPFYRLETAFDSDMKNAQEYQAFHQSELVTAVRLPNETWSKRISGTLGNKLSKQHPDKAILILSDNPDKTITVSLRAPKSKPYGASDICSQYPSGGGRASAAGVNELLDSEIQSIIEKVEHYYR
ncbi:MAG: DHH family phosphoesterase [Kangiellaceae bacterium]|jgi:hypothetical protein|nr:DHH family phosphoesterase [Kangiellaceae bacterium]